MALVAFFAARRIVTMSKHWNGSDLPTPKVSGIEHLFFEATVMLIPDDTLAIDVAHWTVRWKQFWPIKRYYCP